MGNRFFSYFIRKFSHPIQYGFEGEYDIRLFLEEGEELMKGNGVATEGIFNGSGKSGGGEASAAFQGLE